MKLRNFLMPVLLSALLILLASTWAQAYSGIYYVIPPSVSLRECPAPDCGELLTAYRGDKVEIIEKTDTGWSRVRLVDRAAIGWIPSDFLSYSPDLQAKPLPPYYVKTDSLPLRDGPRPEANVLTTLSFNDQVEMLGVDTSGWAKVRDPRTGLMGWVPPRDLSITPVGAAKAPPRRRAPAHKAPPKEEKTPKEAPAAPSAM